MVIDLTMDSDSSEKSQPREATFITNLTHRTPLSSGPLKRKPDRPSRESSVASAVPFPLTNGNGISNGNVNGLTKNAALGPRTPSLAPRTPSPKSSSGGEFKDHQAKAISVVIPSPSRKLKKEIENSQWAKSPRAVTPELTGLSQKFYPTDDYERRALKGAYPRAKKVRRADVPLLLGTPGPILETRPRVHAQLLDSLKRKLSLIEGPEVTLAPGDDSLLAGFAANFEFINTYKVRKGVSPVPESFNAGCACDGVCNPKHCTCLSEEINSDDKIMPYQQCEDDSRLLVLTPDFLKRTSMIYECSSRCNCNDRCWNHVVQRGRTVRFEIFHTGNRGFGLRSPDPIRAGQFIDCYLGEVLTKETADVREELAVSNHHSSYLFGLDFLVDDDDIYVVDGQKFGAPTRFINHSCNPNCRMFPVSRTHGDDRLYDLAFFSLRDIPPMTELTFDYNPNWEGGRKVDPNAVKCLCGEKRCRGQLWPNQRKGTK
ncbi:hypothetical protein AWENTII_009904 [Aspergillus wentii]